MSVQPDIHSRLERIKELWRELERTRPTSGRYNVLVDVIRRESSAYLALLETQQGFKPAVDPIPSRIADRSRLPTGSTPDWNASGSYGSNWRARVGHPPGTGR